MTTETNCQLIQRLHITWQGIYSAAKKGDDVTGSIARAELIAKTLADRGLIEPLGRHVFDAAKVSNTIETRSAHAKFWIALAKRNWSFAADLAKEGIKFSMLAHGAAVITALNGYIATTGTKYPLTLGTVAMFGCFGILMVALGQILLIEAISRQATTIEGRLTEKSPWPRILAIARYGSIFGIDRELKLAERLIYGSVLWFAVYSMLGILLLFNGV